jgi:hypothetical protein
VLEKEQQEQSMMFKPTITKKSQQYAQKKQEGASASGTAGAGGEVTV